MDNPFPTIARVSLETPTVDGLADRLPSRFRTPYNPIEVHRQLGCLVKAWFSLFSGHSQLVVYLNSLLVEVGQPFEPSEQDSVGSTASALSALSACASSFSIVVISMRAIKFRHKSSGFKNP